MDRCSSFLDEATTEVQAMHAAEQDMLARLHELSAFFSQPWDAKDPTHSLVTLSAFLPAWNKAVKVSGAGRAGSERCKVVWPFLRWACGARHQVPYCC